MFRKSALAIAVLGAMTTVNVAALGLGEIDLKSALNQPLDAEVELLSATGAEMQELRVSVAPPQAFEEAGIERPMFLNKLRFEVRNNAEGRPVIHITSSDVVREPFIDFLLEISWSKGRLVREYTVLVDPPVTMPAAPAVTRAPVTAPVQQRVQSGYRVTHTAQMPPMAVSPGEYGPTKRNDTLWKIAEQVRPDSGVSMEQTMLALLRANPEAFIDNNINNLKAGYVLRVPAREDMLSVSRAAARREARAQYAAWREAHSVPSAAATESPLQASAGTAGGAAESHLQLVAPDEAEGGVAAGDAEQAGSLADLQRELMMANEALEAQQRQSEEMSQRLSMLEEQIVNMKRLIELKDDELARLQAGVAAEGGDITEAAAGSVEPTEGETAVAGQTEAAVADEPAADAGVDESADAVATTGEESSPLSDEALDSLLESELFAGEGEPAAEADAAAGTATDGGAIVDENGVEVEEDTAAAAEPEAAPAPVAETPAAPVTATPPGFIDRLLANPLWLGAGGAVLALLAFFGLRRKRSVETEFQESILQAAGKDSSLQAAADSEIVSTEPESRESRSSESSLLSEFAVSDMGSIRNDGEADPLAEADVYLAYGRFQQAEDLIKDALEKDPQREELNLKLLEVYLAGRNQAAFDAHAQDILAKLENSEDPLWEKVAEMGRELSPENPMYREGSATEAAGGEDGEVSGIDALEESLDFDVGEGDLGSLMDTEVPEEKTEEAPQAEEGLDFNIDLSFEEGEAAAEKAAAEEELTEPKLDIDMDSVEPDAVEQDNALDFDLEGFELGSEEETEAEEQGDGQLADLDEVSTKLDLARAYIDMGDPDGAQSILDEVMAEGSDEQKDEARSIMEQIA